MYISKFTDYSFRILIYLGNHPNELFTVEELSNILELSPHHIKKIIYKLSKSDIISSSKGRKGGIKLVKNPKDINLRHIFEVTEDNLNMVECFDKDSSSCKVTTGCKLKPILFHALNSFKYKLSEYTLADIL